MEAVVDIIEGLVRGLDDKNRALSEQVRTVQTLEMEKNKYQVKV